MSEENQEASQRRDAPIFDGLFQFGVIKMMMTEDHFCSQMVRSIGDDAQSTFAVFDTKGIKGVFNKIVEAFTAYGMKPTEAQMRQMLFQSPEQGNKERPSRAELIKTFDRIMEFDVGNDRFYRDYISAFVKQTKFLKALSDVKDVFKKDPEDAPAKMQTLLDNIYKVSFDKQDVVTLKDLKTFLAESQGLFSRTLATGIVELDNDLNGGLPRESLISVLSGTNVGKTMFCISLACNALRATDDEGNDLGTKVLFVALEGMRDEAIMRFGSNLAHVEYGKMINNSLTPEELGRLDKAEEQFNETRLMVRNMVDFNMTIEELIAECNEIYKEFPFDMLIVDYGQLLSTQIKVDAHRHTMSIVHRGLVNIARKFNAVVVTPVQATRQGQETQNVTYNKNAGDNRPVLRSADISEAFEIARVSGVILSLNMTDDERPEGKMRVFLEKQRHGVKGKEYGLFTDFSHCNLIPGKTYNAKADVISGTDGYEENDGTGLSDEQKEEAEINLALGKDNFDHIKMIETMNYLATDINKLESDFKDLTVELESLGDEGELFEEDEDSEFAVVKKRRFETNEKIEQSKVEYKKLFSAVYPNANIDTLNLFKSKYNDLKAKNLKRDEERTQEIENLVNRYKKGMELMNE
jgi:replicative DNA helicase